MESRCERCTIRDKIRNGCCVQGNQPTEFDTKTIIQKKHGIVVRRIEACEHLDPQTGECLNYDNRGEMCRAFNERGCDLKQGW